MTSALPPDINQQIQEFVATGQYASAEEVLRNALAALRRQGEEVAAIAEGIEDMEAGRMKPLHEFDAEFRKQNNLPQDA